MFWPQSESQQGKIWLNSYFWNVWACNAVNISQAKQYSQKAISTKGWPDCWKRWGCWRGCWRGGRGWCARRGSIHHNSSPGFAPGDKNYISITFLWTFNRTPGRKEMNWNQLDNKPYTYMINIHSPTSPPDDHLWNFEQRSVFSSSASHILDCILVIFKQKVWYGWHEKYVTL